MKEERPSISPEMRNAFRRIALDNVCHLYDTVDYVLDTETTGLGKLDEVIEVAVVRFKDKEPVFNTQVMPTVPVTAGAARIWGKTPTQVMEELVAANAVPFEDIYPELFDLLHGKVIGAYNVAFDSLMLDNMCTSRGLPPFSPKGWVDFMPVFSDIIGQWSTKKRGFTWQKLARFNIKKRPLHTALSDCLIVCDYAHKIVEQLTGSA